METETSESYFEELVAGFHSRECLLVLEDHELVQGWGVVKRYSDRPGYKVACETSIYFDLASTGRGYGSRLQKALIDKVRAFGYHHIVTKIWASNAGSLRFHEAFGFELVGVQKEIGFLDGQWLDVAILQCLLNKSAPGDTFIS